MNQCTFQKDGTIEIHMAGGYIALVDPADVSLICGYRWVANKGGQNRIYAYGFDRKSKRMICMHRLITNAPDGMVVDHVNGNKLDNRRCNLRLCYQGENARNSAKRREKTQP